jgi:hypothetical protein
MNPSEHGLVFVAGHDDRTDGDGIGLARRAQ